MKKLVLLIVLLLSVVSAWSQYDTIFWGTREPNFYYWDTCWFDHLFPNREMECDPNPNLNPTAGYQTYYSNKIETGRIFLTDKPLRIIGAVAPVGMAYSIDFPTIDSTQLPEYFCLYTYNQELGKMALHARARHDTCNPTRVMQLEPICEERQSGRDYGILHEAYFEEPIVVQDSFWLTFTRENNYLVYEDTIMWYLGQYYVKYINPKAAHPLTLYYWVSLHYPSEHFQYSYYNSRISRVTQDDYPDQNYRHNWTRGEAWGDYMSLPIIFPIFDTAFNGSDTVHNPEYIVIDSCSPPNDFRVSGIDTNLVTLVWSSNSGAVEWELSVGDEGSTPEEGIITRHTETYAALDGLDTSHLYLAWIRTICDDSIVSNWSSPRLIYIPGPYHPVEDPVLMETADDFYTFLGPNPTNNRISIISSFRILKVGVFNMKGQKIIEKEANSTYLNLNISNLPNGIYIVHITTNHGTTVKKLIVK